MGKLLDSVRSTEVVLKEIEQIHARSKPVRELRETLHLKKEQLTVQIRDLTKQIQAQEEPMQELQMELTLAQKKAGRTVHTLPLEAAK